MRLTFLKLGLFKGRPVKKSPCILLLLFANNHMATASWSVEMLKNRKLYLNLSSAYLSHEVMKRLRNNWRYIFLHRSRLYCHQRIYLTQCSLSSKGLHIRKLCLRLLNINLNCYCGNVSADIWRQSTPGQTQAIAIWRLRAIADDCPEQQQHVWLYRRISCLRIFLVLVPS